MTDLPIVCTLTPETLATRRAELLPGLVRQAELVEDLSDGFRLRFAPMWLTILILVALIAIIVGCWRIKRPPPHRRFRDAGPTLTYSLTFVAHFNGRT